MASKLTAMRERFDGAHDRAENWCSKHRTATCVIAMAIPTIALLATLFGVNVTRNGIIHFMGKTLPHAYSRSFALRVATVAVASVVLGAGLMAAKRRLPAARERLSQRRRDRRMNKASREDKAQDEYYKETFRAMQSDALVSQIAGWELKYSKGVLEVLLERDDVEWNNVPVAHLAFAIDHAGEGKRADLITELLSREDIEWNHVPTAHLAAAIDLAEEGKRQVLIDELLSREDADLAAGLSVEQINRIGDDGHVARIMANRQF